MDSQNTDKDFGTDGFIALFALEKKGARGSLESEKVSGRYFTALCQLFTGPLMWEIAALQMWLIGRQRRRHFAVS